MQNKTNGNLALIISLSAVFGAAYKIMGPDTASTPQTTHPTALSVAQASTAPQAETTVPLPTQ